MTRRTEPSTETRLCKICRQRSDRRTHSARQIHTRHTQAVAPRSLLLLPRVLKGGRVPLAPQPTLLARLCLRTPHCDGVEGTPVSDERRIPQLGRDAEVLAAAHEGVRLGALLSSRKRLMRMALLFANCLAHKLPKGKELVGPGQYTTLVDDASSPDRAHRPATRTKGSVEDAPVLDLGEIHCTVWLDLDVKVAERCLQYCTDFLWERRDRRCLVRG
mmetsp:Transcript_213/g.640  ORF Transcript_213/g.640 Transcript_213/m.640 type:complete len:217 (-) Transcript_213:322-972(-)